MEMVLDRAMPLGAILAGTLLWFDSRFRYRHLWLVVSLGVAACYWGLWGHAMRGTWPLAAGAAYWVATCIFLRRFGWAPRRPWTQDEEDDGPGDG